MSSIRDTAATMSVDAIAALHAPVLPHTICDLMAPALTATPSYVIDATLGMGGHSEAILTRFPQVHIIGIDRDEDALALAGQRLQRFADRLTTVHATYDTIAEVVADRDLDGRIDAVLMDLGVSSLQLDEDERGFSYARDCALDMRMDQRAPVTAATIVNDASERELARILRLWGEERFASRIARAIVTRRAEHAITTTGELADLVRTAIPAPARRHGGNPAKRTFQALRIAVNDELTILERALPAAISVLRPGGRLIVESYHSLEDRMVKRAIQALSRVEIPHGLPIRADAAESPLRPVTKGAVNATDDDIADNPRAASVRIRAAELVRNPTRDELNRLMTDHSRGYDTTRRKR